MASETVVVSEIIPAPPERVFTAWLDGREHSRFTGDKATCEPFVGGRHTAFDGYVEGKTIELVVGRRIVQTWRSTEFPAEAPDSRLEVQLEPTLGGTMITLLHTEIPAGQGDTYRQGWVDYYLSALKQYFDRANAAKARGARAALARAQERDERSREKPKPAVKAKSSAKARRPVKRAKVKAKVKAKARTKPPIKRSKKRPAKAAPRSRAKKARR